MNYSNDDDEFLRAFEACELPAESFHHRDHLRLAWICLRRYGSAEAAARIAASIRRFAAHHGKAHRYDECLTLGWLHLVEHASAGVPEGTDFEGVLAAYPDLLDPNALARNSGLIARFPPVAS